ncbi:MAG: sugar kinase [Clostridiaceae bacterium]
MDVITFGETMVVFNPKAAGPLTYVHEFGKSVGGGESNVAVALARLGHSVGWFSRIGDDEFGRYIKNTIRGEGVDVSQVVFDNKYSTGLLFKEQYHGSNPNVYYYRKDSAASHITPEDINEEYIKQAKIFHITGITPAISVSAKEAVFKALEIAKRNNVLISFDPNLRLKLWSIEEARETLIKVAEYADIIMPGLDEGEALLGLNDEKRIAEYFHKSGVKTVAVKLGKDGCYLSNGNDNIYVKGYKVEKLVDTVGAGDGFAAGFLSGILRKLSLEECGEYANGIGAMATLVPGDMDGYPGLNQLLSYIGKSAHIQR